jgi:glycosyltransferase involved in cell wall biosynthesis
VFINAAVREQFAKVYAEAGVDAALKDRMRVIENCVEVPEKPAPKPGGALRVLFVGRSAPEKRIHLIGRIASECRKRNVEAEFELVGDCEEFVDAAHRPACKFAGMASGAEDVQPYYQGAHVLLLTSSREGFPLVVMEAMAHGAVPVCTNVGGIAVHVMEGHTGVLLAPEDEAAVVKTGADAIERLASNRDRLATLGRAAHERAREYFGVERFNRQWRELLLPDGAA